MAIYDGKNIKGTIGNLAFRNVDGVTIVQSKPGKNKIKQTIATKKSASLFGRVTSPFARQIRQVSKILHAGFYDGGMVNRMNAAISVIMNQHVDWNGCLQFNAESFNRLAGFEFNLNTPIKDYLLISPSILFEPTGITINFKEFKIYKNLKFPLDADHCELHLMLAYFCLTEGKWQLTTPEKIDIHKHQNISEVKSYNYQIYEDTLCLVIIGLTYFRTTSRQTIPINDKKLNPVAIIDAHFQIGLAGLEKVKFWNNMSVKLKKED